MTRALGLQWSCPVLRSSFTTRKTDARWCRGSSSTHSGRCRCASRRAGFSIWVSRTGSIPVLALAVERMTGCAWRAGWSESAFPAGARAHARGAFPPVELVEAASESALVRSVDAGNRAGRPVEARLVRVHDCLWLRMWLPADAGPCRNATVRDLIGSIGALIATE